jgi:precorrin-2 dehydrogenase/sirohydrochlorin ferrochelatase
MERMFPMFVKLAGRPVLAVGAGTVGEAKIGALLDTGARLRVVALRATRQVRRWAAAGDLALEQRAFRPGDLQGMFLVVAATSSRKANQAVYAEAQRRGVLCNVVDVPELCDFFYPAVVRRGGLQIAISTSGQCPALARRIREQLEQRYGPEYAGWVERLGRIRREVLGSGLPPQRQRELLRRFAETEDWAGGQNFAVQKGERA